VRTALLFNSAGVSATMLAAVSAICVGLRSPVTTTVSLTGEGLRVIVRDETDWSHSITTGEKPGAETFILPDGAGGTIKKTPAASVLMLLIVWPKSNATCAPAIAAPVSSTTRPRTSLAAMAAQGKKSAATRRPQEIKARSDVLAGPMVSPFTIARTHLPSAFNFYSDASCFG